MLYEVITSDEGLIDWCTYVLEGLKAEIDKIDMLLDYQYLKDSILIPALDYSKTMKYIDNREYKILKVTVEKQVVQNSDIQEVLKENHVTSISRYIRELKVKKMIASEQDNVRRNDFV